MTERRLRTLAAMRRVARVQEAEAMHELAIAVRKERDQAELLEDAEHRVKDAHSWAKGALKKASVSVGRLALMQELCDRLGMLADEASVSLEEKRKVTWESSRVRFARKHYRDRVEEVDADAAGDARQAKAHQQTELGLEGWLLQRCRGGE